VLRIPGGTGAAAPHASAAPAGEWKPPAEIAKSDEKKGDDIVWKAPTT
jgi:hypothetical protein